jgi:hypothetical protein
VCGGNAHTISLVTRCNALTVLRALPYVPTGSQLVLLLRRQSGCPFAAYPFVWQYSRWLHSGGPSWEQVRDPPGRPRRRSRRVSKGVERPLGSWWHPWSGEQQSVAPADAVAVSVREWSDLSVAGGTRGVQSSRASPPHMPREDGRVHTADSSITNLADALSLLSMWRLSKP